MKWFHIERASKHGRQIGDGIVDEKARISKFNLLCFQIGCYCSVQTYIIQKRTIKFNFLKHPTFLGVETDALAF